MAWQWLISGFGEVRPTTGDRGYGQTVSGPSYAQAVKFDLRYPGQVFDEETGLSYNLHRYYDAATGRYIQADPMGLEGGWNRFGYVNGQPITKTDAMGLLTDQDVSDGFGALRRHFPGWTTIERWRWGSFEDGKDGQLSILDASIILNDRFKNSGCMNRNEYGYFMKILFHEGIHQVEGRLRTIFSSESHHQSIYNASEDLVGSSVIDRAWYRSNPTWDPSFPHDSSNPRQRFTWSRFDLDAAFGNYQSNSKDCTCAR